MSLRVSTACRAFRALSALVALAWAPALPAQSSSVSSAPPFDIATYRWRSRVLLLLAPSPADSASRSQRDALDEEAAGLAARELVVVSAFEDGSGAVDGRALPAGAAAAVRRRYRAVPARLGVVLVGKDGEAKLRETGAVAPGALFALVDRMPMGRGEARARRRAP
jgi:hypothetical protein